MRLLYNVVFNVALLVSSPYYLLKMWRRGNWTRGFGQRLGRYDARIKQAVTNSDVIWIHAVSVGEARIAIPLVEALERRAPNAKILVSTTTSTGMSLLRERLPSHVLKIHYPLDFQRAVHRAHGTIRPRVVALVETEIWPNFLWRAKRRGTPVVLLNARLSTSSYRNYRRFKFLFGKLFASLRAVGAQRESDRARLEKIGCKPDAITVTGSLKFECSRVPERVFVDVERLFRQAGFPEDAIVLLAGSTHAGEETVLIDAFLKLSPKFPRLRLAITPRHTERSRAVAEILEEKGVAYIYRSQITPNSKPPETPALCLLVNSTGELREFYRYADIVFVGKSLTAKGGQNPIEPAVWAKPILFGPDMSNFKEISDALVQGSGAKIVKNEKDLILTTSALLSSEKARIHMGIAAKQIVSRELGALEKSIDLIIDSLDDETAASVGARGPHAFNPS